MYENTARFAPRALFRGLGRVGLTSVVAVAGLLGVPHRATAGPITFSSALPVADQELVFRQQLLWRRSHDDPSPKDRRLDVVAAPSVVGYGLHERVTVFGTLPFLYKRLELETPAGTKTRSTSGFGDMKTFVRGTLLQFDAEGRTARLAAFGGLKLPTGADDEADELGRLPQPLQLGTGSWDPLGGLIFTWQTLQWEFDTAVRYSFPTEANDFQAGDQVRANASFQYRVASFPKSGGVPSFLYAVAESNFRWTDRDVIAGKSNPDSGGTTLHLDPGLQWVHKRWVLESIVQIPALQNLNGSALENDFIARLSFRAKF